MIGWIEQRFRPSTARTISYTDPLHAGRHPFQTFMLTFVVISSVPIVSGRVAAGSIESTLPRWAALTWGLSLMVGAAVALGGSFWRGRYDTALLLERTGLDFAGFAAIVYAFVIVLVGGFGGLVAAAITAGFGVSCLTRARDIARIFTRATLIDPPRVKGEHE